MLRPTVSRPVYLGIKRPFGAYEQIFITCVTVTVLILWGALSDERTVLSFIHAAGPCQRNHILLSQIRNFPFRRLLRLAGSRWRYSITPHTGILAFAVGPLYVTSRRIEYRTPLPTTRHFLCAHIRCRGNVFTSPLLSNWHSRCAFFVSLFWLSGVVAQ
jgi:hypothetical protein